MAAYGVWTLEIAGDRYVREYNHNRAFGYYVPKYEEEQQLQLQHSLHARLGEI